MKIALTFDIERDIPGLLDTYYGVNEGLPRILRILNRFNIKCTFFWTGNIAEKFPEIVKSLHKEEHEIASHGLNHQRLNKIGFESCKKLIQESKTVLENIYSGVKVIGFRAPYLKPPKHLFEILRDLEFGYDSSINSPKKLIKFKNSGTKIKEFHPKIPNLYFRFKFNYSYLKKRTLDENDLTLLYFHPWEAINIKDIITKAIGRSTRIKNIILRPDRVYHTGEPFIQKLGYFIEEALAQKAQFLTLREYYIKHII